MRKVAFLLLLSLPPLACGKHSTTDDGGGSSSDGQSGGGSGGGAGAAGDSGGVGGGKDGGVGETIPPQGELLYWLQHTSAKVQPTTAAGPTGGGIAIEGARGATESYQIVLRPPGGALSGVQATASDLKDGAGDVLTADHVTLYRQTFIDFTGIKVMGGVTPAPAKSPTNDGRVPDALVPLVNPYGGGPLGAPFDVAPDTNQPIWVDVTIPVDQAPGTYTGSISFQSGAQTIRVPLSVAVWDITLPDLRAIPAWFKLDYNYLEKYHAGVHDCFYSHCDENSPGRMVIKWDPLESTCRHASLSIL